MKFKSLIVILFIIITSLTSFADCDVEEFSWLPNSESNLAGYIIYYGLTAGGPYPYSEDQGIPPTVDGRVHGSVTGLNCNYQTYYFVCVAINTSDVESDPSQNEVMLTTEPDPSIPTSPQGFRVEE